MYPLIRRLLFLLPEELAHRMTLRLLPWVYPPCKVRRIQAQMPQKKCFALGLQFPNPVGLAAGLDKNGEAIDALFGLGFGFVEIGAVTPNPQPGNPKPRLFRLPQAHALINRMGFNNLGVDYLVQALQKRKIPGIVGVNLGKNRDTPLETAYQDYEICLEKVYPYVDYVSINISSPNTAQLQQLQDETYLQDLLERLMLLRRTLEDQYNKRVPLLVKVSSDLNHAEIDAMAAIFLKTNIDGIIAVNTTQDRSLVKGLQYGKETGGLSGKPLFGKMLEVIARFKQQTYNRIPLIAVGGIQSVEDARQALQAGASLIQLYTGLIYEGPKLIKKIVSGL